jgi:hypothetical protein
MENRMRHQVTNVGPAEPSAMRKGVNYRDDDKSCCFSGHES